MQTVRSDAVAMRQNTRWLNVNTRTAVIVDDNWWLFADQLSL